MLQQLAAWIHSYIAAQNTLECVNSDIRVHAVFYAVCQALFYTVTFRHRELLSSRKSKFTNFTELFWILRHIFADTVFLQSLNLPKMVTCPLNPLRFCQPTVLQNFAAVTRNYQLAYCYTIIEHNSRNIIPTIYHDEKGAEIISNNMLDSFFPFDPYLLKRSGLKIQPYYRDYQELTEKEMEENKRPGGEVDDFLGDDRRSPLKSDRFPYGSE